ncbi:MAG: tetratricopeptide repeat protein [Pseudomonadota bacterium]
MKKIALATAGMLALGLATSAYAAGGGSGSTSTTKQCKSGEVYDKKTKSCKGASRGVVPDDDLVAEAVGLAYAGEHQWAADLLVLAENPEDPRILNYLGFTHRKMGKMEVAMDYYMRALAIDPDYNLARSYMAQGLVADGKIDEAVRHLDEIRARGGKDTWAYTMLANAIEGQSDY